MFARLSTYRMDDATKLVEGFDRARGPVQGIPGFEGAYFLVDREGGRAISLTLWASEEALNESARKADQLRQGAAEGGAGSIESVDHYEVVLTAGAVAGAAAAGR